MGVMFTQQYTKTEPHTAEQSPQKTNKKPKTHISTLLC